MTQVELIYTRPPRYEPIYVKPLINIPKGQIIKKGKGKIKKSWE